MTEGEARRRIESVDLSNTDIDNLNLTGARVRGLSLEGAHLTDAWMPSTTIDGAYFGLRVNGVLVGPLIQAEILKQHPLLNELKPDTADGMRAGFDAVYELWDGVIERARALPEEMVQAQVDREWSVVETIRHLVFATDAWIIRVILDDPHPYHPLGLPPPFMDEVDIGRDRDAHPTLEEALSVRADRQMRVRELVRSLTDADLDRWCEPSTEGLPPGRHKLGDALTTILGEEYWHSTYVTRDLNTLQGLTTG